jgi:hypothetical protein
MTKLCSVCGTENREEAQFCRACGTAFATIPGVRGGAENGANVCSECGFQNKPGLRYCANCGMSLAAASEGTGSTSASDADAPYSSPPPISYPSFAPVAPYPPAPSDREQPPPDIPDPAAEIALLQQQRSDAASPFSSPAAPNRAPLVVGGFAVLLVVAGVAAWIFMRGSNPAPPAVGTVTTPVVAVPAPGAAPATTSVIAEPATASGAAPPTAGASAVEPAPATATAATTATTTSALGAPPAAAAPLPQVTNPGETPEEEAKRLAAEKRRDKAARDKAERDAKAKAAADQRDQTTAAAQKAEQDAQAAQRTRQSAAAPAPPPPQPVAQAHGVREICAGRGTIAEAVCQSRQCGSAEHANEPICRQLREQDERRRNMQY